MNNRLKNGIAIGIGVLIAVVLGEGLLRLMPNHFTQYGSQLRYAFDASHGYKLQPGLRGSFNMACFQNDALSVNSHGFRDNEWKGGRGVKIGILGDSFMEALQVPDDSTTAARLEQLTGVEVLNTGLSGFGTVGQSIIFDKHLKAYRPDVTLLFYYPPNDLINNHCALNDSTNNAFFAPCPCALPGPSGPIVRDEFQDTIPKPSWMWQKSMLFRVASTLTSSGPAPRAAETYGAYRKPYRGQWAEAEALTEHYLRQLNSKCDAVNSQLVVVTVPSFLSQTPGDNWESELLSVTGWEELPQDFDRTYPNQVIRALCDSSDIPIWELEPAFQQYRDAHGLADPTFFFECNGHWNPLGHRLAAEIVADSLETRGWLGK